MNYSFDDCELDADLHELRVGGEVRTVEPQVFDLLLYLVANRDRMVSKDELFEHVWEGRIVSEANLSNRIGLARQAVGDDGQKQALIKTFPRRGFRFVGTVEERDAGKSTDVTADSPAENSSRSDKPSIAVLPFDNLSDDPEQEYFSDGIAEDIIAGFSRMREFFVVARNSTFTYKGQAVDVRKIASELGVRYVLGGSVRKSGNRVRIGAQLIDGETGNQLWADRYDRELEDIFAVQDEITQTVVGALQPELAQSEIERSRRKPPDNLDAWDLYQQGLWHEYRTSKDDNAAAIELYKRAVALDQEFTQPLAGLGRCYFYDSIMGYTGRDPKDAFAPAQKAVEIDPQDANARSALGGAYFINRDHATAMAELDTAIRLNPSEAQAYWLRGFALSYSGRAEEGLKNFDMALKLSPRDVTIGRYYGGKAASCLFLGRYEDGVDAARKAVQNPPWLPWTIRAYLLSVARSSGAKGGDRQRTWRSSGRPT